MEVPDGDVVEQASLTVDDWHLACARAVARGAEPRHLLGRADRVPLAEQREEVVRMVGEGRQGPWFRTLASEDGGDGERRGVVDGRRARVPGCRLRQTREVRIPLRVERPVPAHQRAHRELVEDHEDDGGVRRDMNVGGLGVVDGERNRRHKGDERNHRQREGEREERAKGGEPDVRDRGERGRGSSAAGARPCARGRGTGRAGARRGTRSSRSRSRAARRRPTATRERGQLRP